MFGIYTGALFGCHRLSGAVILRAGSRCGKARVFMAPTHVADGGRVTGLWRIETCEELPTGSKPSFGKDARPLGLLVKKSDSNSEDLVKAPAAKVRILKAHAEEVGSS